jgi:hypothetical protein
VKLSSAIHQYRAVHLFVLSSAYPSTSLDKLVSHENNTLSVVSPENMPIMLL